MSATRRAKPGPGLSIRELVESALEQEDIMPLVQPSVDTSTSLLARTRCICALVETVAWQVRVVFDAPASASEPGAKEAAGEAEASPEEDDTEDGDPEDEEGRARARRGQGKGGGGTADAVLAMLQKVSEEQAEEIAQVCRCAALARAPLP